MHIAQRGAKSGQWVTCPAQSNCRVGGTHTTASALQDAKRWAGVPKVADLTQQHYIDYLKSKLSSSDVTQNSEPVRNVKPSPIVRPRRRVNSYDSFTAETPDERDERIARENNEDGKVTFERDFTIKSRTRWLAFLNTTMAMDVHIDFDTLRNAGKFFAEGGRNFEFKKEQIRVPEEKVEEFKVRTDYYIM